MTTRKTVAKKRATRKVAPKRAKATKRKATKSTSAKKRKTTPKKKKRTSFSMLGRSTTGGEQNLGHIYS
ncbi:MAG: hypothetical protein LBC45_03490 [Chlamydiales bacterium]|jgi:hypothetical protein|nr:hypothetical protein [Chlamydiales bacterium]